MKRIQGFTVVELLIVIVVIGILATLTIISYSGVQNNARSAVLASDLEQNIKKLDVYRLKNNEQYPADLSTAQSAAGVASSSNVSLTYYREPQTGAICLEARSTINTGLVRSVASWDKTPRDGYCSESGLVGWWRLNGNTNDSSGYSNNGTISGTVLPAVGWNNTANGAYQFDGASSINVSDSNSLDVSDTLSLSGWAYFDTGSMGVYQGFVSKLASSYELNKSGNNGARIEVICGGANHRADESPGSLTSTGQWYFVVSTFNAANGDITLYVNGSPRSVYYVDPHVGCSGIQNTTTQVMLGGRSSGGLRLYGRLDDVRVYNRILTAEEASAMYTRGAY